MQSSIPASTTRTALLLDRWSAIQPYLLIVIVLVAIVGGAALRLYNLGTWSFWIDEVLTIRSTYAPISSDPPRLTYLMVHLTNSWFGISEGNARLIPAILGILMLPIFYGFVRRMFDAPTATVASILLAVAPWHIYWSQNARHYIFLVLLGTIALFLFYLSVESDRRWGLVLAALVLMVAVWEHSTALLALGVMVSYVVAITFLPFDKPAGLSMRNAIIFGVVLLIFAVPIALVILPSQFEQADTLQTVYQRNNSALWLLLVIAYYVRVPMLVCAAASAFYLLSQRNRAGLLLALWCVIPVAALVAISFVSYSASRYAFIILPAVVCLAAVGVVELWRQVPRGWPTLLAAALPLLLVGDALGENLLYHRYNNGNRPDWQSAFAFISDHQRPDDRVVTTKPPLAAYYLDAHTKTTTDLASENALDPQYFYAHANSIEATNLLIAGDYPEGRVWIIEDHNTTTNYGYLMPWINENAHMMAQFDTIVAGRAFPMRVWLFDPEMPKPSPE